MKEKATDFLASAKALWAKASKKARILFLSGVAAVLIISLVTAILLNQKNYVLLYNGLSTQESANVLAALGEMGIEPQISPAGAISVPEADANRARMQLATQGLNAAFDYDIYREGAGLTATQADKNQWQINQLQNRLQDTIETFEEVNQAVVTISVPQPSVYALQNDTLPPTASVKLQKVPGKQLTPQQIQGILNIVKNAVSGLTEDNISITDETGDLKGQLDSAAGASISKLNLTEEVNRQVRNRILGMLQPAFGSENIQVAVNSVLDTDFKRRESTEYQPFDEENPRNNPLANAEYEREKLGGQEGGAAQGVPGANDNVDVPQYAADQMNLDDADSYAARDVYNYLVNSVQEQIIKEGLEITDMTVAVLINTNALPDSLRDQVVDLVTKASGVDANKISVQNIQFAGIPSYTADIPTQGPDMIQILIVCAVGGLALCVIITMIIMHVLKKRRQAKLAAAEGYYYDEAGTPLVDLGGEEEFEPITIPETNEQKLKAQIKDLAQSDPEIVRQLIKTWLLQA